MASQAPSRARSATALAQSVKYRTELPVNLIELRAVGVLVISSWRAKWTRVRLVHAMVLFALIALGLRVPSWWSQAGLGVPDWWEAYRREKSVRDAWSGPVTIRVSTQDELGTVLAQFKAATVHPQLRAACASTSTQARSARPVGPYDRRSGPTSTPGVCRLAIS